MSLRYHLDTDFLVHALTHQGPERTTFAALTRQGAEFEMSAIAWYEFARGPRSPEQLARGRDFLGRDGVIAVTEELAERAADIFRQLGSPRRRGGDLIIAVTAIARGAHLLTGNLRDYSGIEGLLLGPA